MSEPVKVEYESVGQDNGISIVKIIPKPQQKKDETKTEEKKIASSTRKYRPTE